MMSNWLHRCLKLFILIAISCFIVTAYYSHVPKNSEAPRVRLAASECKVIKHQLGETCVPVNPQRIIVVDHITLEVVLALGIKPVAAAEPDRVSSKGRHLMGKMEGISSLGKESQLNLERIVRLHPDLILGLEINSQKYKLFSQIAPTVTLQYVQTGWQDTLRHFGEILAKNEQAQGALAQYQHRLEKFRTAVSNQRKETKISVSRFYAGLKTTEFRTPSSFPVSILEEAGLSIPVMQRQLTTNSDLTFIQLSLESLDLLDADVMFVALDPGAEESFQKYQKSQLWQQLNVVKNDRVYTVDSSYWIFGNLLSANFILDDLYKYLLGAT